MTRANIPRLCCIIGVLLAAAFMIKVYLDYRSYSASLNSAPFYVWIIADALYFLLPALILLITWLLTAPKR